MKTFKLKKLIVKEGIEAKLLQHEIKLLDGLIINREDEQNRWLIEAFIDQSYLEFFKRLEEERQEIMLEVKITKESNPPATFITNIISVNEIGDRMNVLFMGTIVDRRIHYIEDLLERLVKEGYKGEELLRKFKAIL